MIFPTIMFWVWMALNHHDCVTAPYIGHWDNKAHVCVPVAVTDDPPSDDAGNTLMWSWTPSERAKPQSRADGGTIQQYCWVYPKSKRRDRGR